MKKTLYLLSLVLSFGAYAQSGINTKTPQVTLQVNAKNTDGTTPEGIIAPRMTGEALHQADLNNVYGAAQDGTLAFVTEPPVVENRVGQTIDIDKRGYYYYDFPANKWLRTSADFITPQIGAFVCDSATFSNTNFILNASYSGTLSIPYTGGNGADYPSSLFVIDGLTFVLPSGTLADGNGTLTYYVNGVFSSSSQSMSIVFKDQTCDIAIPAIINEFNCGNSLFVPAEFFQDFYYEGTLHATYTNGNGGAYPATTFSTNGLTFSLPAGTLNIGSGTLEYTVTGTPTTAGNIFIPVNFAGNTCITSIHVTAPKVFQLLCDTNELSTQNFVKGIPYSGSFELPYTGGNGLEYPQNSFTIHGLTFTLQAGVLTNDTGILEYTVTGTPTTSGVVNVPINFADTSCTISITIVAATVDHLDCASAAFLPTPIEQGEAYTGTLTIPYEGGNGLAYGTESFTNNGLTFSLPAGVLANGSGTITYDVTGTPTTFGAITIPVSFGGQNCEVTTTITPATPTVSDLECSNALFAPQNLEQGVAYTGTLTVPYTGGNGAPYQEVSFAQDGLTFTLPAGVLAYGSGNIVFAITGTPTTSGLFDILLNFSGQVCNISTNIIAAPILPSITGFVCSSAVFNPLQLEQGLLYSGTLTIPYQGGNGGQYLANTFVQNGLTFTLQEGILGDDQGNLVYNVTGIPTTLGDVSFEVDFLGQVCEFSKSINAPSPKVNSLSCSAGIFSPNTFLMRSDYTGTFTLPYTGGNGIPYLSQSFTSNGLTFTLQEGTLANGSGNIVYNVSGTLTTPGTKSIGINFGGKYCTAYIKVLDAIVLPGNPEAWMLYNLGADTTLPFDVMDKRIYGNYYKWGNPTVVANSDDITGGAIAGWNTFTYDQVNTVWKTALDPCPDGFKIPTSQQWQNLLDNSRLKGAANDPSRPIEISNIGPFGAGHANFNSAKVFSYNGMKLVLPSNGAKLYSQGHQTARGSTGAYWSSTPMNSTNAYYFRINKDNPGHSVTTVSKGQGNSIRCISIN